MVSQCEHTGVDAGHLGDQHHTRALALAVDVVRVAGTGERLDRPSRQVGFWSWHGCSYLTGNGGCVYVAAASVRYSFVPAAPGIASCAAPLGTVSRGLHTRCP